MRASRARLSTKCFLFVVSPNSVHTSRLGVIASKKTFNTSVRRNRVRRLCKETFRQMEPLPGIDLLVIAKGNADGLSQKDVLNEWQAKWAELKRLAARILSQDLLPPQSNEH